MSRVEFPQLGRLPPDRVLVPKQPVGFRVVRPWKGSGNGGEWWLEHFPHGLNRCGIPKRVEV